MEKTSRLLPNESCLPLKRGTGSSRGTVSPLTWRLSVAPISKMGADSVSGSQIAPFSCRRKKDATQPLHRARASSLTRARKQARRPQHDLRSYPARHSTRTSSPRGTNHMLLPAQVGHASRLAVRRYSTRPPSLLARRFEMKGCGNAGLTLTMRK